MEEPQECVHTVHSPEVCEVTVHSTLDIINMEEISPTESCSITVPLTVDNETEITEHVKTREHLFQNKLDRDIFTQKVLSIFLLQTMAVGAITAVVHVNASLYDYSDTIRTSFYFLVFFYIAIPCLMVLSDCCNQFRKKSPYNYIILICQPVMTAALIVLIALMMRGIYYYTPYSWKTTWILEAFLQAWKNFILVQLAIVVYSVFPMGSKNAFSLRGTMFLAAGVFCITYLRTLTLMVSWNANATVLKSPFPVLYLTLFLYLYYLYVLYDIYTMTGSDYHQKITPNEYVNGAVNLHYDLIIIIVNFIKRLVIRVVTILINAIRNKLNCFHD